MRDFLLESWLTDRLQKNHIGPEGNHEHGWSYVGGCEGSYILSVLHPEIKAEEQKGAMYPGTMGHHFMQNYVFPAGSHVMSLEVLSHEQDVYLLLDEKHPEDFYKSPIDTRVYDHDNNCFGLFDYKFVKDLKWVQDLPEEKHMDQVNLYAYLIKAMWYIIIYTEKLNYDNFIIHRMETDPTRAQETIDKLRKIKRYLTDPMFASETHWTAMASGLNKFSPGTKGYRYICEPSTRNPNYQGCPYKDLCLELLSKEFGIKFTSFTRYDAYLTKGVMP